VSARILPSDVPYSNTYHAAPGRDFILDQIGDGDSASDRLHQPYECANRPDISQYPKYHNLLRFVPEHELEDLGDRSSYMTAWENIDDTSDGKYPLPYMKHLAGSLN
jgi:hypothetical protein